MQISQVSPGKLHLEFGPISMTVAAWAGGEPLDGLCREACAFAGECLSGISAQLPLLKRPWPETNPEALGALPHVMWEAVSRTGVKSLTPMAAVAGAMSDQVADWLWERGAARVIVNNGGDIALRLAQGERVKLGIISSLANGHTARRLQINSTDGIGGVATSGLGGRSFTLGIADAVTAFGGRCAYADACATALANSTYVRSPAVTRRKAALFDPASDIASLDVTIGVSRLSAEERERGFRQLGSAYAVQEALGNIIGAAGYIQGDEKCFGKLFHQI